MNRYGKAGLALLGIGGLAGFISLLGGPNVFSTFSSSISTLFPEAETPAVEEKPQEKLDETPVVAKAEELQKIEEIAQLQTETEVDSPVIGKEEIIKPEKLVVDIPQKPQEKPIEKSPPSPPQETKTSVPKVSLPKLNLPSVSSFITGISQLFQGSSTSSSRKVAGEYSGGDKYKAPSTTKGAGSQGFGRWCATSSGVSFMEEGGTCMGWRLKDGELVKVD